MKSLLFGFLCFILVAYVVAGCSVQSNESLSAVSEIYKDNGSLYNAMPDNGDDVGDEIVYIYNQNLMYRFKIKTAQISLREKGGFFNEYLRLRSVN